MARSDFHLRVFRLLCISGYIFSSCVTKEKEAAVPAVATYISGKWIDKWSDKIRLSAYTYSLEERIDLKLGYVNPADSTFHITLDLINPVSVRLLNSDIFVKPGDSVYVEIDSGDILHATGENAGNYLISTKLGQLNRSRTKTVPDDPEQFKSRMENNLSGRLALIDTSQITPDCKLFFKAREQFSAWYTILSYYTSQKDTLDFPPDFLSGIPLDTFPIVESGVIPYQYWWFINHVFYFQDRTFEHSRAIRAYADSVLGQFPENYTQPVLMKLVVSQFNKTNREFRLKPIVDEFYKNYVIKQLKDSLVQAIARDAYNRFTSYSNKLPDYVLNQKFSDPDGRAISFSEILEANKSSGKGIYLDLWASWCGPCIAEIEASKLVDWSDIPLQKMYISLDHNKEKWAAASRKYGIESNQYLLNLTSSDWRKNPFIHFMGASSGIPRYVIITGDGKLFSPNAPRPSNYEQLKKLTSSM